MTFKEDKPQKVWTNWLAWKMDRKVENSYHYDFIKVALEFEFVRNWYLNMFAWWKWKIAICQDEICYIITWLSFGYFSFDKDFFLLESNKKKMRLLFLFNPHFSSHAHKDKNDTNAVKADWNILPTFSKRNEVMQTIENIAMAKIEIVLVFDLVEP